MPIIGWLQAFLFQFSSLGSKKVHHLKFSFEGNQLAVLSSLASFQVPCLYDLSKSRSSCRMRHVCINPLSRTTKLNQLSWREMNSSRASLEERMERAKRKRRVNLSIKGRSRSEDLWASDPSNLNQYWLGLFLWTFQWLPRARRLTQN